MISAALARTQEPELSLAAYSVAFSIAALISSAMWGIRQISNTFGGDREMLRRVRRLALSMSTMAVGIILLTCIPPITGILLDQVMGIPAEIGKLVTPALLVMALNPYLSVGRGFYQGVLVRYGRAGPIGVGAVGYLLGVAVVMVPGVLWTSLQGALLAALAMMVGQLVYFVACWWPARAIIRNEVDASDPHITPEKRSASYVFLFYLPLALSIIFTTISEPILQSGMARAPMSSVSLAAYPVCIGIMWLGVTPLYNAQQLVIAQVRDRPSYLAVRRFIFTMVAVGTVLMACVAIPAVSHYILGTVVGLTGEVKELAVSNFVLLPVVPLVLGSRSLFHGTLVARHHSAPIRSAALLQLAVLIAMVAAGGWYGGFSGLFLAICAKIVAAGAEVLFLAWHTSRLSWSSD